MLERSLTWALFFASGFAALVYQVSWMRELGLLFGNTSFAAATTLAAFFLGIAAGGAAFGGAARRFRRPLRAYAWLEAGVGAGALLYFGLLDLYHAIYAPLFAWLGEAPRALLAAKFALALLVLFPPAFAMGGTLPVMSQHLVRRARDLGATAAALYAVNTAGAALGAYATAFHLVRHFGVTGAYGVALATTAAVALLAGWLGRKPSAAAAPEPAARAAAGLALPRGALRALAFLSGFATLALEVLWTRMFAQVLQNSVYTFALILVTFLVALALGGAAAGVLARTRVRPETMLAALLVGSGLLVAVSPFAFFWETDGLEYIAADAGFAEYVRSVFASAARVLLLPTAWLGVVFPYCIKLAEGWGESPGRVVGELAATNTLGAVAGSLCAGFVLLETLGLWDSLRCVAVLYLLASLALVPRAARAARRMAAAAAFAAAAGLALVASVLDPSRLPLVSIDTEGGREALVEVFEGSAATVAVVDRADSRRIKLNNYYGLGGSGDRLLEARQAHWPLLLHPMPRSIFFLGLGTGITAGAALQHPLETLLVAELVPEVVAASRRHFTPWLSGLFEDPRARVVVEDGRNLLAGTDERFDVIVADLFLPWKAGTGSLYARELYEAGLARLAPGGLYAQWLLLIQFSPEEFGSVARTFLEVFPRATLWRGDVQVSRPLVLLLGERDPRPLDPAALTRRIAALSPETGAKNDASLHGNVPTDVTELLLAYQGDLSAAAELFAAYPTNSDAHPIIEYDSPVTQRQKRTDEARAFRGRELVDFYDALFATLPPERDPMLEALDDAQRELPRAGLDRYRAGVLAQLRDVAGTAAAMRRYRQALDRAAARPPALREPAASN